jgi:hypothetical protein
MRISWLRIGKAKFLLQLFDDGGKGLIDRLSIGLSEFYSSDSPIRIESCLRAIMMDNHPNKIFASRGRFSNGLRNCRFKFR